MFASVLVIGCCVFYVVVSVGVRPNENKISDGYRERALNRSGSVLVMENVVAQRVAVRCIVWLDDVVSATETHCLYADSKGVQRPRHR